MPPKRTTPTKPTAKKATPTKQGVTKPSAVGRGNHSGTTGAGRSYGTKQAPSTGPGKKAVTPVKGKTAGSSKGDVKSPTEGAPKKRVWTERDTMARKIQNAYRVYRCKKKLLMLKKKKEEFDELMGTLEREVFVHMCSNVCMIRLYRISVSVQLHCMHNEEVHCGIYRIAGKFGRVKLGRIRPF